MITGGMKYIVVDEGGMECAVLFPCFWKHDSMLQQYPLNKIVSAGTFKLREDGTMWAGGGSTSLRMKSREEDLALILRHMQFEP